MGSDSNAANEIICCDMVLLEGNVIVDESMLTGESIPVTKIAANSDKINAAPSKANVLLAGTRIIQTRGESVTATVARTGFYTIKGQLLTSIMFPKPLELS